MESDMDTQDFPMTDHCQAIVPDVHAVGTPTLHSHGGVEVMAPSGRSSNSRSISDSHNDTDKINNTEGYSLVVMSASECEHCKNDADFQPPRQDEGTRQALSLVSRTKFDSLPALVSYLCPRFMVQTAHTLVRKLLLRHSAHVQIKWTARQLENKAQLLEFCLRDDISFPITLFFRAKSSFLDELKIHKSRPPLSLSSPPSLLSDSLSTHSSKRRKSDIISSSYSYSPQFRQLQTDGYTHSLPSPPLNAVSALLTLRSGSESSFSRSEETTSSTSTVSGGQWRIPNHDDLQCKIRTCSLPNLFQFFAFSQFWSWSLFASS